MEFLFIKEKQLLAFVFHKKTRMTSVAWIAAQLSRYPQSTFVLYTNQQDTTHKDSRKDLFKELVNLYPEYEHRVFVGTDSNHTQFVNSDHIVSASDIANQLNQEWINRNIKPPQWMNCYDYENCKTTWSRNTQLFKYDSSGNMFRPKTIEELFNEFTLVPVQMGIHGELLYFNYADDLN